MMRCAPRPDAGVHTVATHMIRPSIECWLVRTTPSGPVVLLLHAPDVPGKHPPLWQPVSGGIEPGEDPVTACCREVAEEAGLVIAPGALELVIDRLMIDVRPDLTLEKSVFAAPAPAGEIRIDRREHDGHRWCALAVVTETLHWDSHRMTWARTAPVVARLSRDASPE
jgi:dihydroneopterin triphosphate diphosphatase